MIWRSIVPRPLPILLLAAIALTIPVPDARAQDRAIQDRLDRLERDLSMLQRQVYRGGPAPVVSTGSSAAVDAELRMDRLETQMRELTGRIEDEVNRVEQLRNRLEQINADIDVRFSQGQPRSTAPISRASAAISDSSPSGPIAPRSPAPSINAARTQPPTDLMPPGTLVAPPSDGSPSVGTLTPAGPAQTRTELADAANGGSLRPPSASNLPAGSTSEQYNVAFGLLKQPDYPAAEEALKAFVAQHPSDPLASSAQYWLGQTYYARGRYTEAASAFADGYKRQPKGVKAADDLLWLAISLAQDNQKHNACLALVQLDHDFPNPGSAIKERAIAEKKRLGC